MTVVLEFVVMPAPQLRLAITVQVFPDPVAPAQLAGPQLCAMTVFAPKNSTPNTVVIPNRRISLMKYCLV